MNKPKTPNALPPTVLSLGPLFDGSAMTLEAAREVYTVDSLTIGNKQSNKAEGMPKNYYPYHLIDFRGKDGAVIARSRYLRITKKQMVSAKRALVRKLAVFLFENKGVA